MGKWRMRTTAQHKDMCLHRASSESRFYGSVYVDHKWHDVYTDSDIHGDVCCFRWGSEGRQYYSPGSLENVKEVAKSGMEVYQACAALIEARAMPDDKEMAVINAFEHLCQAAVSDMATQDEPPEDFDGIAAKIAEAVLVDLGNREHALKAVLDLGIQEWARVYNAAVASEVGDAG